jgi:hypothetical protein
MVLHYCITGATVWPQFIKKDDLMIDPYPSAGNASMFINDCRNDPHKTNKDRKVADRKINVTFLFVTYKGWPYIFIKASAAIRSQDEFILDYGNGYWTDSVNLQNSFEKVLPHLEALHESKDELKEYMRTAEADSTAAAAAAATAV